MPGERDAVAGWFGRHFARSEQRRRATGYVRGLPGNAERTTGWHLAEDPGDPTPDGVQHLLARADWDADPVRDDLAWYVAEHLGAADGVPVVDETGFLKEGVQSRGAAGRSTGTAAHSESAQVGVLLGYATPRGRVRIDRAPALPTEWVGDAGRRAEAGVPTAVGFATELVPGGRMVDRAVAAGVPARWVTADAVYGSGYHSRIAPEHHGLGSVAGVRTGVAVVSGWRPVRALGLRLRCRPTAGNG